VFLSTLIVVVGLLSLGAMGLFFASGMPFGAGFQPTPKKAIRRMIELSRPEGKVVYDLGSGFGRLLFEVAGHCPAACLGIEVDWLKCWWTRREARRRGLQSTVKVVRANLLRVDLSKADVVFAFLSPKLMRELKRKVLEEMRPGSIVASYNHTFEGWQPESVDRELKVYFYRLPLRDSADHEIETSCSLRGVRIGQPSPR
jgi:predicted RNA methylase